MIAKVRGAMDRLPPSCCRYLLSFNGIQSHFSNIEGVSPDPGRLFTLAKPRIDFPLASENVLECFIKDKKNTKGLTSSGEEWLRDTVWEILKVAPSSPSSS